MTESDQALSAILDKGLTNCREDRGKAVLLIRAGVSLETVSRARAWWHTWTIETQRKWQASVSRRPPRGKHHDSWEQREKYVRCNTVLGRYQ